MAIQTTMFFVGLLVNFMILYSFPALSDQQYQDLVRYPRSGDDLRLIYAVVQTYAQTQFWHVVAAYISIYINFQSFGIPGTCFLAILSGPIFGFKLGFSLSHLCSVAGASICYMISKHLGASFVQRQFPERLKWFKSKINENRHNLFFYFMFLRITPICPNWFLNISSSVVGVPYSTFLSASLVGLIPYTYLLVSMGMTLNEIQSVGLDFKTLASLMGLGLLSLLPTLLTKRQK